MDTITFFNIVLRLAIWFLLTGDLSVANILIGVAIALLLPFPRRRGKSSASLKDWLKALWGTFIAIPQAYIEAIQIMVLPHNYEKMVIEKVPPGRSAGLVFWDIFLITFTPKTIVIKYEEGEGYQVHYVTWKKPKTKTHK